MKTKQTLVCGTRNLCFALAAIFALAFIACDDGSGDDKTDAKKDGKKTETDTKTYTVTFDSNGGSEVEPQTITEGNKAAKPTDPTKAPGLMAGLWTGTPTSTTYTFAGWQRGGAAYDFDTPVTANITLTAAWTAPSSPIDLSTRSGDNIIAQSIAHINADDSGATEYTLVLDANVSDVASITHNKNGVTLTVTSVDTTERTISKGTANGRIFTVGGTSSIAPSSAKLVIDGNITLQGKDNNTVTLVGVNMGGSLELKGNAKITGNNNISVGGSGGGVSTGGDTNNLATITMSGNAEISGNTGVGNGGGVYLYYANLTMSGNAAIKNNVSGDIGGGVCIYNYSTFTMNGGEISGNSVTRSGGTARGGGVYIQNASQFTVLNDTVKANIKNNTATNTGSGTAEGPQVYKNTNGVFTVGGIAADTY